MRNGSADNKHGSADNKQEEEEEGGNPPSQQQPPLEKLKVAKLKVLLRQKNLPVAGNKAEIVTRLKKYPNGIGPKLPKKGKIVMIRRL